MQVLRLIFVLAVMPLALVACQNSRTDSNAYGGGLFDQPIKSPAELKQLLSTNEAASSAIQKTSVAVAAGPAKVENAEVATSVASETVEDVKPTALAQVETKQEIVPIVALKQPAIRLTPKQRMVERSKLFAPIIERHAKANGVPVELAMAVVQVESNYRPSAVGRAGEIGLMQLLPRTARYIGYDGKMKHLHNPDINIRYGMKYLGKAYRLGGGSTCGTILKYNAGHAAKKMNKISRHYCNRVQRILQQT